jgi:hypothetical protein
MLRARFDTEPAPFNPWLGINPAIASQLTRAGVAFDNTLSGSGRFESQAKYHGVPDLYTDSGFFCDCIPKPNRKLDFRLDQDIICLCHFLYYCVRLVLLFCVRESNYLGDPQHNWQRGRYSEQYQH